MLIVVVNQAAPPAITLLCVQSSLIHPVCLKHHLFAGRFFYDLQKRNIIVLLIVPTEGFYASEMGS